MSDRYLPPSAFLHDAINEKLKFGEGDVGDANLKRLIDLTRDEDVVNRDWATLLLAQLEIDRPDVRDALLRSASDENAFVRGEAILGLAHLDRSIALTFLQKELRGEIVTAQLLEAAAIVADKTLVADLEAFAEPSDDPSLDRLVSEAVAACQTQV
ncbi:MAG: HEAT repeat domain-containing protein [Novosphingobium sp.]